MDRERNQRGQSGRQNANPCRVHKSTSCTLARCIKKFNLQLGKEGFNVILKMLEVCLDLVIIWGQKDKPGIQGLDSSFGATDFR